MPRRVEIEENAGTDRMTLRVCGNADSGHVRLVATLDSTGKGAGGAAVQNLNILAGLDPLAGLILPTQGSSCSAIRRQAAPVRSHR